MENLFLMLIVILLTICLISRLPQIAVKNSVTYSYLMQSAASVKKNREPGRKGADQIVPEPKQCDDIPQGTPAKPSMTSLSSIVM